MPKISIITINYNNKKGLEKTILSVINQSKNDFEYIVIDGNSSDGSKELIESYQTQISYSISEPDNGIYHAMNKGIKVAKGDYILFLNSGDSLFENNVVEKIEDYLSGERSFYYGNFCTSVDGNRNKILFPPKKLSFSFFVNASLPHPATFIKRSLFEKYFSYNESLKIVSDWEFFMVCIVKMNETYQYIDVTVSDFDESGMSSQTSNQSIIEKEKQIVFKQHFPCFKPEIEMISSIGFKKIKQMTYLSKQKYTWKVLKAFMKVILFMKRKLSLGNDNVFTIRKS